MKKHYVTFFSPGTFFDEDTTKEIDSWDVALATKMAKSITERYSATPNSFQFSTRERGPKDFDSKETKRSVTYYLPGAVVETLKEVEARNDPSEEILRNNMRGNGYLKIVRSAPNAKGWRWCKPLNKGDVVL